MMDVYQIIIMAQRLTTNHSQIAPMDSSKFLRVGPFFPINSSDLDSCEFSRSEFRTAILERLLHRREVEGIESYPFDSGTHGHLQGNISDLRNGNEDLNRKK